MNKVIISALIVLSVFAIGFGQQHTENKSDQALRGSGRVNASTLGMEIDIPLGSYPGRGINVPISLSYSSKLWRMDYSYDTEGGIVTGGCRSVNEAKYSENSASGWTTSLAVPYIEYTGKNNLFNDHGFPLGMDLCPNAPPNYYQNAYVRRLTIHLPSGETHELRADDTSQIYPPSSSCPNPPPGYTCYLEDPSLQANWNRTYYAVDGSNIKYIEDSTTNTYRLQMPDGSYYDFSLTQSWGNEGLIRNAMKFNDRNGNFTTYNAGTGAWTDTLGRSLSAPIGKQAPPEPTTQTYLMPGMTGSYKFYWKMLKGASATESGLTDFNQELKYRGPHMNPTNNGNWALRPAGTYLFNSEFEHYVLSESAVFNPVVLTEIELPTGQKYKFSYNIFGLIEKITYPTGGDERLVHNTVAPLTKADSGNITDQANFGVTNRKVYPTPGGTFYEWSYSAGYVEPSGYKIGTTNPDETLSERYLHRGNDPCTGCEQGTFGYDNGLAGMPYEEKNFTSTGQLVARKLTSWTLTNLPVWMPANNQEGGYNFSNNANWHPRATREESIIYDAAGSGISTTTTFEYDGDLNLRETPVLTKKSSQYAFVPVGSPLPANPVRVSESTFLINDPNYAGVKSYYTNQNMVGLATASEIRDGAGTIVSRSETVYDEPSRSPGYRGNPTTAKVWDSTKGAYTSSGAYIATSAKFDSFGNQYEATDAKGNTTTTTFDSTYNAFPIQVTSPVPSDGTYGSNTAFVTTATFDYTTGLPLTTTDANGLETRITYDPVTLRPQNTKIFYNNVQVGSMAETIYHDEPGNYWVKNRAQIDENKWAESISYFDGLGRAYKSEQIDSQGNIFTEKEFDADGRVLRVSNPFRTGGTKVWTTNVYDEASRVKEVVLPDGAKVITDYGVSVTGTIGTTKQITDQAGKKRKGIADALGRMVQVIEDPTGQNLNTDYVFDTLGNLRKTIQGEQNRYFMHDSLGRLLYAKQPEQDTRAAFVAADPITNNTQWSAKYEYDDNGNITKTTDARGVYIQGTYDKFNRIIFRDYSDTTTPDVSFYYDGTGLGAVPNFAKGKTTKVTSSISETRNTSFDNLGRLLSSEQRTPFSDTETVATATPRVTGYQYNLSGALIEETYPSGRVVKNTLDTDGDLSQVQSRKNANYGYHTYAGSFTYDTAGAVKKMQLGNGRWETALYNNRLQVTQIGLGVTDSAQDLLKLEYSYGTATQNNGSLREQKITVPSVGGSSGFTAIQTYAYDDLNRLQSAVEMIGTQTWKQTFTIDRYGNRRFNTENNNTTTLGSCMQVVCNPNISTANNKFTSGQGYGYDASGNVTQDAQGQRFGYDAENHQKEFFAVGNGTSTPDATYLYDGEGKRVKKISNTETTVFVYNASGTLVAEYSIALAVAPQVSYLTTDHLGSPRITTNQTGAVISRKDFAAFGDDILSPQRTGGPSGNGYDPPNVRQDYTGYQKDGENGLEFAQARYYNASHGRFTSVDPLTASASIRNPQTFNRYSYVLNSPYKFTDPLGLLPQGWRDSSGGCGAENSSCSDDWGSTWDDQEEISEQQDTQVGIAENQETEGGDQQEAPEAPPPPAPTAEQNESSQQFDIAIEGASLSIFGRTIATGKVGFSGGSISFEVGDDKLTGDEMERFGKGREPFFVTLNLGLSGNVDELVPTDLKSDGLTTKGDPSKKNDSYLEVVEKSASSSGPPKLNKNNSASLFFKASTRGEVGFSSIKGDAYKRTATASFQLNYAAGSGTKSASIRAIIVGSNAEGGHVQRALRITVTCQSCK